MQAYSEFAPTAFDVTGLAIDNADQLYVAPVVQTRDSEALDLSNWQVVVKELNELNCNGWQIHRFHHWASGWFEIILCEAGSSAAAFLSDVEKQLEEYAVLDEEHFSQLEFDDLLESMVCPSCQTELDELESPDEHSTHACACSNWNIGGD